jgi:hypothetical protein
MYECDEYNKTISGLIERIQDEISDINIGIVSLQTSQKKLKGLIHILESLNIDKGSLITQINSSIDVLAWNDGRPIFEKDRWIPNYNDIDIVLHLPCNFLKVRLDPQNKSKLIDCPLSHLGRRYTKLLVYMLSHPKSQICSETTNDIYKDGREIQPTTLSKSIKALREILHQSSPDAPYILTVKDPAEIHSMTGHFYQMNPKCHYLVIVRNFENSSQLPQQRAQKLPSDEF